MKLMGVYSALIRCFKYQAQVLPTQNKSSRKNISNGKKVFIFDAVPELFVLLRGPDLNLAKVVKGGGVAQRRRGCGDTSLKMRKSDCLSEQ